MNEKITEFAKQAHETCFDNPYFPNYSSDRFNEKFAELIVKDCIGCIDIVGKVEWPAAPTYELAIESSKLKIQQHFGITE
jgi:hypothetical protein